MRPVKLGTPAGFPTHPEPAPFSLTGRRIVLQCFPMDALYYVFSGLVVLLGLAQAAIVPHIRIAGVHPDMMLVIVVSWSMLRGVREGILWALMAGIVLDLLSAAPFGMFTLSLVCAALIPVLGTGSFFRSHAVVVLISVALATICSYVISLSVLSLAGHPIAWLDAISRLMLPGIAVNLGVTMLLFPPVRWLHLRTAQREMQW